MRPAFAANSLNEIEASYLAFAEPYRLLGLADNAPTDDIKERFRELALAHHTDKDREANTERFAEIAGANEQLRKKQTAPPRPDAPSPSLQKILDYYAFCDALRAHFPEKKGASPALYRDAKNLEALNELYQLNINQQVVFFNALKKHAKTIKTIADVDKALKSLKSDTEIIQQAAQQSNGVGLESLAKNVYPKDFTSNKRVQAFLAQKWDKTTHDNLARLLYLDKDIIPQYEIETSKVRLKALDILQKTNLLIFNLLCKTPSDLAQQLFEALEKNSHLSLAELQHLIELYPDAFEVFSEDKNLAPLLARLLQFKNIELVHLLSLQQNSPDVLNNLSDMSDSMIELFLERTVPTESDKNYRKGLAELCLDSTRDAKAKASLLEIANNKDFKPLVKHKKAYALYWSQNTNQNQSLKRFLEIREQTSLDSLIKLEAENSSLFNLLIRASEKTLNRINRLQVNHPSLFSENPGLLEECFQTRLQALDLAIKCYSDNKQDFSTLLEASKNLYRSNPGLNARATHSEHINTFYKLLESKKFTLDELTSTLKQLSYESITAIESLAGTNHKLAGQSLYELKWELALRAIEKHGANAPGKVKEKLLLLNEIMNPERDTYQGIAAFERILHNAIEKEKNRLNRKNKPIRQKKVDQLDHALQELKSVTHEALINAIDSDQTPSSKDQAHAIQNELLKKVKEYAHSREINFERNELNAFFRSLYHRALVGLAFITSPVTILLSTFTFCTPGQTCSNLTRFISTHMAKAQNTNARFHLEKACEAALASYEAISVGPKR